MLKYLLYKISCWNTNYPRLLFWIFKINFWNFRKLICNVKLHFQNFGEFSYKIYKYIKTILFLIIYL